MLKWLLRLTPLWRLTMEARVESVELRVADLNERLRNFLNRDAMRRARGQKDDELTAEAAEVLKAHQDRSGAHGEGGAATALSTQEQKLALYRKLAH